VPSLTVVLLGLMAIIKLLSVGKGLLTCLEENNSTLNMVFPSYGKREKKMYNFTELI
jgi:hypothetical protein